MTRTKMATPKMWDSESAFTRWWTELLRRHNAIVKVFAGGNRFQQAGVPDRYIVGPRGLCPGVWIESKHDHTPITELQYRTLRDDLCGRGVPALVLRGLSEIHELRTEVPELASRSDTKHKALVTLASIAASSQTTGADILRLLDSSVSKAKSLGYISQCKEVAVTKLDDGGSSQVDVADW